MNDVYDFRNGDICWTNTPYSPDALMEIPAIELYGWKQRWGGVVTGITSWYHRIANTINGGGNPYEGLYIGDKATDYILPFLSETHHSISQGWNEDNKNLGATAQEAIELAQSAAKMVLPAVGILYPKSYVGPQPMQYSFTFHLINTNADTGSGYDIITTVNKNKMFLEKFIEDNLHDLNGSFSITPPLIYEVKIPGIRWSPAATITGLTVNNKGTLNKNVDGIIPGETSEYIYPDAWEVTVTITELINESKSMWRDAIRGSSGTTGITTRLFK